jgi:large subunit ribosomal protein L29
MKVKELREKSNNELQKILKEEREKLRKLRFDLVAGKIKNVREIRKVKKEIARILTVLNEKIKNKI